MSEQVRTAVEELAEAVARYREKAAQEAHQRAREIEDGAQDAQVLIKRAQDFVETSGVGRDLAWMADQARPWPAWARRGDDFSEIGVMDVTGGEEAAEHDDVQWCEFARPDGSRWRVTAAKGRRWDYDGNSLGVLSLDHEGQRVLEMQATWVISEFSNKWRPGSVESLRIGDGAWVMGLAEMVAEIKARREVSNARALTRIQQRQASKIEM